MIPVFAPKYSLTASVANLFANGEQGAWYETEGFSRLSVVSNLMVTAISRASVNLQPEAELFRTTLIAGRPLADIDNSGRVTSQDALEYGRYVAGTATQPVVDYIEQVMHPYMLMNPGPYAAYLAFAEPNLFQTVVGVEPVTAINQPVGLMLDKSGNESLAKQPVEDSRPVYKSAPARVEFDGIDDELVTTFPVSLGSDCTVGRAIPGTGAQILTNQTVGTSFTNNVNCAALVVVDRALTSVETERLTAYLNAKVAT